MASNLEPWQEGDSVKQIEGVGKFWRDWGEDSIIMAITPVQEMLDDQIVDLTKIKKSYTWEY